MRDEMTAIRKKEDYIQADGWRDTQLNTISILLTTNYLSALAGSNRIPITQLNTTEEMPIYLLFTM